MDNEAVVFSVFDGLLESTFRLIVAFSDGFAEPGAQPEFQISFLVQIGDHVLDPFKTVTVEIAVHIQFIAVGYRVDGKFILKFLSEIQKVFMEGDLQIFPVHGSNVFRIN